MKFYQVTNIHSVLDEAFKQGTAKYGNIKMHYTSQCDSHDLPIEKHVVYLVYTHTRADGDHSILLTSEPPFDKWSSLDFPYLLTSMLLGVAWDLQRNTVVLLMKDALEVKRIFFTYLCLSFVFLLTYFSVAYYHVLDLIFQWDWTVEIQCWPL